MAGQRGLRCAADVRKGSWAPRLASQVVSSSNRFQSEEVLERDRQRQRAAACDLRSRGGGRHVGRPLKKRE